MLDIRWTSAFTNRLIPPQPRTRDQPDLCTEKSELPFDAGSMYRWVFPTLDIRHPPTWRKTCQQQKLWLWLLRRKDFIQDKRQTEMVEAESLRQKKNRLCYLVWNSCTLSRSIVHGVLLWGTKRVLRCRMFARKFGKSEWWRSGFSLFYHGGSADCGRLVIPLIMWRIPKWWFFRRECKSRWQIQLRWTRINSGIMDNLRRLCDVVVLVSSSLSRYIPQENREWLTPAWPDCRLVQGPTFLRGTETERSIRGEQTRIQGSKYFHHGSYNLLNVVESLLCFLLCIYVL